MSGIHLNAVIVGIVGLTIAMPAYCDEFNLDRLNRMNRYHLMPNIKANWIDARDLCIRQGWELPNIQTKEEYIQFKEAIKDQSPAELFYWTTFVSVDGNLISRVTTPASQFDVTRSSCQTIRAAGINNTSMMNCDTKISVVCEDRGHEDAAAMEDEYLYRSGDERLWLDGVNLFSKYKYVAIPDLSLTWYQAKSYCSDRKMDMATVRSENEDKRLNEVLKDSSHPDSEFWVGAKCDRDCEICKWNERPENITYGYNIAGTPACTSRDVLSVTRGRNHDEKTEWTWGYPNKNKGVVCEKRSIKYNSTGISRNKTYTFVDRKILVKDAIYECLLLKKHLLSIESAEELANIRQMVNPNNTVEDYYWIFPSYDAWIPEKFTDCFALKLKHDGTSKVISFGSIICKGALKGFICETRNE